MNIPTPSTIPGTAIGAVARNPSAELDASCETAACTKHNIAAPAENPGLKLQQADARDEQWQRSSRCETRIGRVLEKAPDFRGDRMKTRREGENGGCAEKSERT